MRLLFLSSLAVLLAIGLAEPQPQNFLTNIANRFMRPFRIAAGRPRQPPPQAFQPHVQHQEPHVQHHQEPHVQHHQEPHVQHHQQPHATHHQSSHVQHHQQPHTTHHQTSHVQHHQQPHVQHQQQPHVQHQQQHAHAQPAVVTHQALKQAPSSQGKDGFGCKGAGPNHFYNGRGYILTFLNGCKTFEHDQADDYCQLQGGRALSLDDNAKIIHFHNVTAVHRQRYWWTGGNIDHNAGVVTWPSGAREGYVRGERFWSPTGGATPPESQPDNREGDEICIAVLNNFYADGIKWHDVSCHHKKPTICEL